jgi:protein ImuB
MPPRHILSIWLAAFAIDRWRIAEGCARGEGADAQPLVLIAETVHGPRIQATNSAARSAGARIGTMLADARTLCPSIAAVPGDPAGDLAELEKLAAWAHRWGPWSALDPPDGLLVDVTAVAHLFGGEVKLLADVHHAFGTRGFAIRASIAPTAGAAWALAHYGPDRSILAPQDDMEARLCDLPVAALRLDDDVLTVLRRLGLKRLGEVGTVGRDALHRRFRNRKSPAANPLVRMDQLLGRVPEPLLPVVPQQVPLVQRRLMEPIRHRDLLDRVLGDLAADMVRELEGQGTGARRLDLGMWRVDGEVIVRRLELAAATRDAGHIVRLFGEKLSDVDAGFGIELVRLRASWAEALPASQDDIEAAAERHGTSLSAFVDRLTTRLGPKAVRRPVLRGSHVPERSQAWQPPLSPEPPEQEAFRFHARPLKLLDKAEPIAVLYATPDGFPQRFRWRGEVHEIARVEGPERIAPEWWRERGTARLRDYYRIEDDAGRRYWIYRYGIAGDGRGGVPEWFVQGLCA